MKYVCHPKRYEYISRRTVRARNNTTFSVHHSAIALFNLWWRLLKWHVQCSWNLFKNIVYITVPPQFRIAATHDRNWKTQESELLVMKQCALIKMVIYCNIILSELQCTTAYGRVFFLAISYTMAQGSVMVNALGYENEGRGFETQRGEWIVSIYLILPAVLGPGVYSASYRKEYQKQKSNVSEE
jgi:hypothetical protein